VAILAEEKAIPKPCFWPAPAVAVAVPGQFWAAALYLIAITAPNSERSTSTTAPLLRAP